MSGDLPQGWATATLSDVLAEMKTGPFGSALHKSDYVTGGIPVINPVNIIEGRIVPAPDVAVSKETFTRLRDYALQTDDIIIARRGEMGRCAVVTESEAGCLCGTGSAVIRLNDSALPTFIQKLISSSSVRAYLSDASVGTTMENLNQQMFKDMPLALPPLAEQRWIVVKLETLLGKVGASQERLARIPVLLKRFRQSVLAAACSGRLTADWREENPSSDTTEDDELPCGWQRKAVEELIPRGGIFDGPFGSNLKSDDYTDSGVRVIRLENIGQLRFIGEKETFISREKYETLQKHTVGEGDIIFASFIADEVRACVLPKLSAKAIAKADCFCLRPKTDLVDRKYLVYQLVSQASYNMLVEKVHGATRPRINTTQLRNLEVRICPLAEQQEIVRRVEGLFALADQIDARYAKAAAHVEKLTQSILAKAFRGDLVPQDPDDEPASVLLERIRSNNNNSVEGSPKRSRKTVRRLVNRNGE